MDGELLIALLVLWISTTSGLFSFLRMWFTHGGEAFHPHSVDVEHRHGTFLVVNSKTVCKHDCVVKSISEFVAPRGSSSSKQFTVLIVMIAVAGFLGTSRWFYVGDASFVEAILSFLGFSSLLLVTAFELDVVPERFLEDKLIVTGWLIEKLRLPKRLPFKLHPHDERFKDFIRSSHEIYYLYEEDIHITSRSKDYNAWNYATLWPTFHMVGACSYVTLVPASIILNDIAEEKVGWITGTLFAIFCFLAYLTGNYVPVLKVLRGWVLLWNPFLREPHFMLKLKRAVEAYHARSIEQADLISNKRRRSRKRHGTKTKQILDQNFATDSILPAISASSDKEKFLIAATEADRALDSVFLRFARSHPRLYLRTIGKILVFTELVAMMTPSVAMGLQWVTALCDGPPLLSIIELVIIVYDCIRNGDCSMSQDRLQHCIVKS